MVSKGKMIFVLSTDGDCFNFYHYLLEEDCNKEEIYEYDFIEGKEFLNSVRTGCFSDFDGFISEIIVNGYVSNLGLAEEGVMSGKFLIGGALFEELCNEFDIVVNWANK